MKRTIALLLSIIITLASFPTYVSATEIKNYEDDPILDLACEVFPEYADKIRCQNTDKSAYPNIATASKSRELVANETRAASDNEYITYTEYSDGIILLTDYTYGKEVTITEESSNSLGLMRTMDIYTYCIAVSHLGNITFKNIKYTILDNDFDIIRSTGTTSGVYQCEIMDSDYLLRESASENAYITFDIKWYTAGSGHAGYFLTSRLKFSLGNNIPSVVHFETP